MAVFGNLMGFQRLAVDYQGPWYPDCTGKQWANSFEGRGGQR